MLKNIDLKGYCDILKVVSLMKTVTMVNVIMISANQYVQQIKIAKRLI